MSFFRFFCLVWLSVFVFACGGGGNYRNAGVVDHVPVGSQRAVVRSASLSIEVEDVQQTAQKTEVLIKNYQGYVGYSQSDDEKRHNFTVHVPSDSLDNVIKDLSAMGKVLSISASKQDVTGQQIDVGAKLDSLKALRARLRQLLAKAKTVDEILKVEKELARIQLEIDTIERRHKHLNSGVKMSVIHFGIERKTIYGPIGYLYKGTTWIVKKLFVIR